MPSVKLTEAFLKTLTSLDPDNPSAGAKRARMVFDTMLKGFGVNVTAAGSKSFHVRWTDDNGKSHRHAIPGGSWPAMRVEVARDKAFEILRDIRSNGRDPKAEKKAARELRASGGPLTVGGLIDAWERYGLADRRASYRKGAPTGLRRALSNYLTIPATELTRKAIISLSEQLQLAGKRSTANSLIAHLSAMYGWAVKTGRAENNPFLGAPRPSVGKPGRVLSDCEIGAVYAAAGLRPYPSGALVQVLLLTGVRLREAAEMEWSELNADLTEWVIPGSRMKNHKRHVVHLSEPVRAILRNIRDGARLSSSKYVFTTTGAKPISGFSNIKDSLDATSAVTNWRMHDFRHTLASRIINEGVSPITADMILAHMIPGIMGRYQLNEFEKDRAVALDKWGRLVTALANMELPAVEERAASTREKQRKVSSTRLKALRAAQIGATAEKRAQ